MGNNTATTRIQHIDGLKATGAFLVFFCHFNGLMGLIELPDALRVFGNGEFAVSLFLVLSGYSISLSLSRNSSVKKAQHTILSRYFRFAIPISIVTTLAYLLYLLGAFYNHEVATMYHHQLGLNNYNGVTFPSYLAMIIFAPMGYCPLNSPLWMLKHIFVGTFLIVVLHIGTSNLRIWKKLSMLLFAIVLTTPESVYLSCIIMGMVLFILQQQYPHVSFRGIHIVALILLIFSLYTGSYCLRVNGEISFLTSAMLLLGASSLVAAILISPLLQIVFSTKPLCFLGKMSFEFYLFHWPIVCSLSCFLWLSFTCTPFLHWTVFIFTTVVITLLSYAMCQYINPKICKPAEKYIMDFLYR